MLSRPLKKADHFWQGRPDRIFFAVFNIIDVTQYRSMTDVVRISSVLCVSRPLWSCVLPKHRQSIYHGIHISAADLHDIDAIPELRVVGLGLSKLCVQNAALEDDKYQKMYLDDDDIVRCRIERARLPHFVSPTSAEVRRSNFKSYYTSRCTA